jgi:hypothetical protein
MKRYCYNERRMWMRMSLAKFADTLPYMYVFHSTHIGAKHSKVTSTFGEPIDALKAEVQPV